MKKKSIVQTSLVISLIGSMMVGCSATTSANNLEVVQEVVSDCEGTIKINTYMVTEQLEKGIEAFSKKYPNVHIEVDSYINDFSEIQEGKTTEKYITELNTAFMSGEIGDILVLDEGLPSYKYIESGYLADLTSFVEGENGLDDETYYKKIIDAACYKENYYCIPLEFYLPEYGINQALLEKAGLDENSFENNTWSVEEIIKAFEQIRDESKEECYLGAGIAEHFFMTSHDTNDYIDVANKVVTIDSEEFIKELEMCQSLVDNGYLLEEPQAEEYCKIVFQGLAVNEPPLYNRDFYELADPEMAMYNFNTVSKPQKTAQGEVRAKCTEGLSVTEHASNPELCWTFIKFMLSDEVQSGISAMQPINRNATKVRGKELMKIAQKWGYKYTVSDDEVLEDYQKQIEKRVEMVTDVSWTDEAIWLAVMEGAREYFDGTKSAEDVAKSLQNKIEVMLNE